MRIIRKTSTKQRKLRKPNFGEHTWVDDPKCAPLVRKAWTTLIDNPKSARSIPGYLRGVANVQEKFRPKQAMGLRELIRHAQEIVHEQRKPYQLPTG